METFSIVKEWIEEHAWASELAGVLFSLILLNLILKKVLSSSKKGDFAEGDWRLHLESIFRLPVRILFSLLLVTFGLDVFAKEFKVEAVFFYINGLRSIGIVVCIAWALIRAKSRFFYGLASRAHGRPNWDPVSLDILERVFTILIFFVSFLIVMQIFGVNVVPLITFGGVGAAVIGFASKDVIANFFGGLMVYITRPFAVYDTIEIPDKKILGKVQEIGWYMTSIIDPEKKPFYVPNSIFASEILINHSRITHRKIHETLRIRYQDAEKALSLVQSIRALLETSTSIDSKEPILVFFKGLGPYSLEIGIEAYSRTTRYEEFVEIQQKLLVEILRIIGSSGAEIPYPTHSVVHFQKNI